MELPGFPQLILIGLIGIILLWVIIYHIRIVQEYERVVVFRLGRSIGSRGPGLVLLVPFVHRPVGVDLRERFFDVPPQSAISQDNATLSIDFIVYMRVDRPGYAAWWRWKTSRARRAALRSPRSALSSVT